MKKNTSPINISRIKTIGFIVKHHQPIAASLAEKLAEFILKKNGTIVFAEESQSLAEKIQSTQKNKKKIHIKSKPKLIHACDLIIVLGGDGTFLSIARLIGKKSPPIMGINMGQLGFLTEVTEKEAIFLLTLLIDGVKKGEKSTSFVIKQRSLLEVCLKRNNKSLLKSLVVNDAVISKGAIARIIGMDIWVNNEWVHEIKGDGLIISTPTGSTAYALAAGGPIIEPSVEAFLIVPICPHSLTLRSLLLPDASEVKICLKHQPGHVVLTLDGQEAIDMKEKDIITIRCYKKNSLKIISPKGRDYFSLLREKLKFGARD